MHDFPPPLVEVLMGSGDNINLAMESGFEKKSVAIPTAKNTIRL